MAVRVCLILLNMLLLGISGLVGLGCLAVAPPFEAGNEDRTIPWCMIVTTSLFSACLAWAGVWSAADDRPIGQLLLIGSAVMAGLFGFASLALLCLRNSYGAAGLGFALLPLANMLLLRVRREQLARIAT